jgi:hypothetical protein
MLPLWKFVGKTRFLAALAGIATLLLPGVALAQTWTWSTEDVDVSGKFTSLAADDAGNLHLSYASDEGIKYGFRPAGSSKWFTMVIDKADSFTRIALDSRGNPHICYTPETIKYASWNGRKWEIEQIDPGIGVASYSCSLAIAADGTPHVVWYQERNLDYSNYLHFKYAVLQGGVWLARTIDFDAQTGKWNSMSVDAHGFPHISYDAYVSGQLKYASWDGKNWTIQAVDARSASNEPYRGMGNSLVLDSNGRAMISYYYEASLKIARQQDRGWAIETVSPAAPLTSWTGYRSFLILDLQGLPHIAYDDGGTLKHAYWDGKRWHIQVLVSAGDDHFRYCSMTVGRDNSLYISYRDPVDGSLKVAVGRQQAAAQAAAPEKK